MGDENPEQPRQTPDDASVSTYTDIEIEVNRHFGGKWKNFLLAVQNPAEILHFILKEHFEMDTAKLEDWAKKEDLPPDWVPRFYSTLTADGALQDEHKMSSKEDE